MFALLFAAVLGQSMLDDDDPRFPHDPKPIKELPAGQLDRQTMRQIKDASIQARNWAGMAACKVNPWGTPANRERARRGQIYQYHKSIERFINDRAHAQVCEAYGITWKQWNAIRQDKSLRLVRFVPEKQRVDPGRSVLQFVAPGDELAFHRTKFDPNKVKLPAWMRAKLGLQSR